MKFLIEIGHPAQVHTFKNLIKKLKEKKNTVYVVIREKNGIVSELLDHYKIKYYQLAENRPGMFYKMITMVYNIIKLSIISKRIKPDIIISPTSPYSGFVSKLRSKFCLGFLDSEPSNIILRIAVPLMDKIITPEAFRRKLPKNKQIRINSYKELAYLHPHWFKPNVNILKRLGLKKDDTFILFRFGSFDASHDINIKGISIQEKRKLIQKLEPLVTKIFISSEKELPKDLKPYELPVDTNMMHDVISYSTLVICDTQTTTTEAACLGIPVIRSNTFVGPNDMSNFLELENKYGLIYNIKNEKNIVRRALILLKKDNLKKIWSMKREKLLSDKIDLTNFIYNYIYKVIII